jgi:outer membrane protein OmpA-like peptidoglycan-associated protein
LRSVINSESESIPSEDNIMRNTIFIICFITLISASPAIATEASKEEKIGVGSGAIIGAIAGGPVGFVIGATLGAKLGDTMHQKNQAIEVLAGSLEESRNDTRELNSDLVSATRELERVRHVMRPGLINMLEAGIAMDLLFRTDEYALADTTGDRLASLAGTLASMPDVKLQLDGFADERGDEDYNLKLSEQRVEFVRDQLVAAGVHPSRIQLFAHGEAPAQDATDDSYALERRVSLTLFIDDSLSFAQNPN